jgi:hypothetical protein
MVNMRRVTILGRDLQHFTTLQDAIASSETILMWYLLIKKC